MKTIRRTDMYSGGYAGKILRINLCNRTSREERLSEESELGYDIHKALTRGGRKVQETWCDAVQKKLAKNVF
jgi:hypothetical protein